MKRVDLMFFLMFTITSLYYSQNKYEPNWESLNSRPYPQWFTDAKLGIFIHWGVSSVPSYSGKEQYAEWFLRGLQLGDTGRVNFQKRVYGEDFTYRDYAPLFKAELFDANEWADIFKKSGAKYITFVSKHHDGYCLWPSKFAPGWNSMDVGPKRDIVGELTSAVRKAGLKMGLYYSLTEWNNPLHRWYTDPHENIGEYVEKHMIPQFKEVIGTYKPSLIFSDGEWFNKAEDFKAAELISWYYNLVGEDAIVNNRWGGGSDIGFLTPEYSSGLIETDRPWVEVRGLGRSFGLNRNEKLDAYMTSAELVHLLVKSVARGGGIIINVGPGADGQIPLLQQERLIDLGNWLDINGEAIYGAEPWIRFTEEKDVFLNRIDPEINFNWVRNSPGKPIIEDRFSCKWTGFIEAPETGKYTFTTEVDDAMKLWIDDKLLINKGEDKKHSADGNVMSNEDYSSESGTFDMKAGEKYPIRIDYYENDLNARINLFWSSENDEKQIIPQTNLFSDKNVSVGDGLKAEYQSKSIWLCYTKNNDNIYITMLEWPGKELVIDMPKPKQNMKAKLLGTNDNINYNYKNGKLYLNLSEIYHNDLPCDHAWTIKLY
ncbi:MAG: alpha-L-fucosidase [Ignavibacteriales bacterium]|nr:alpha-L-fucosidase [Ignavibacteriales bacterium]